MENISDLFVDELFSLSQARHTSKSYDFAKRSLWDYLGVTYVGAKILSDSMPGLYSEFVEPDMGRYTVIGTNKRASLEQATFLNGFASHVAELDDGVRFGALHPGAPIISGLLSIAQKEKVEKSDFLNGIIVGYECAIRLAMAVQPNHYLNGYHPTATCGSIGAAIGISAMLGFSKSQMKHTFSAAVSAAFGTLKVIEDESQLKPFNVGRAALNGIVSARLAKVGVSGPKCPLTGDSGFFNMTSKNWDEKKLIEKLPVDTAIELTYIKPYAACRHAHPAIEASLKIKNTHNITVDQIRSIDVLTYEGVIGKHDHRQIHGVSSSKMSIPFSVAVALINGQAGIADFTLETINNQDVSVLTSLVRVSGSEDLTALVPTMRSAILKIVTNDGKIITERVDFPKGEPENPLTDDELDEKVDGLLKYAAVDDEQIRKIRSFIWDNSESMKPLFSVL